MPELSLRALPALACLLVSLGGLGDAWAQDTRDLGLPPPSGSQYPVLPPPSGSQNPVLPPPSGQRYLPGVGGPYGEGAPRRATPRTAPPGSVEIGVAGSLSPVTQPFDGMELNRIGDIAPALRRCWEPPVGAQNANAMATVRFSLRRDGSLFGQPRATWGATRTDRAVQDDFTRSVVEAVRACTPMRLSARLGAAIAGRPFSIRFNGRAPSQERQF